MKVKTAKKKSRPFLVLPLLENMPKNTGLKLFTKTWPSKKPKDNEEENERPLTATLDKPTILNISLIGIIDMSTIRKEFLDISNLCRLPLKIDKRKRNTASVISRPLSLPSTENFNKRKLKRPETSEDSWEEEDVSTMSVPSGRRTRLISRTATVNKSKKSGQMENKVKNSDTNNNNNNNGSKTFKIPRKRSNVAKLLKVNSNNNNSSKAELKSTKLPEPCKTCGRPDQPERFHSHPATPLKPAKKIEDEPPKMKSTVQKPVAIKYKSKQSAEKKALPPPQRKPSLPAQKLVHTPPHIDVPKNTEDEHVSTPRVRSAKRTLTCYICGREFGTASLALHEPKCIEKWERENMNLPNHLRRKPPVKPDHSLTPEEWNKYAWESSQSTLIPCSNCGRTFFPDRLVVHLRSCKIENLQSKLSHQSSASNVSSAKSSSSGPSTMPSAGMKPPPSVECYICGKKFGTHSIKIHEKQCLKKWHLKNEALPPNLRAPEPKEIRNNNDIIQRKHDDTSTGKLSGQSGASKEEKSSGGSKKAPLFPCYLCGKLFTVTSIYIHEPQCLKIWKAENDKLPPHKRRQEPLKPDIKFTPSGGVDYQGTFNRIWDNHLAELVPCHKCGRTFFPDRIETHENACNEVNIKKVEKNKRQ